MKLLAFIKRFKFWIILPAVILALALLLLPSKSTEKPVKKSSSASERVKKPKSDKVKKPSPEANAAQPTPAAKKPSTPSIPKTPKASKSNQPFTKRPGALQLPDGKVLTFPPPKPGAVRLVHAYGHTYECDSEGNFRDITPRKLFHTAFEGNFLALAVEGRSFIPAFLTGLDEKDVRAMLTKKYEPIGDESEDELAQLKAYDEMRNAALDYMDQGGSFDDFVNEFAKFEKDRRHTQAVCLREIMTLYKQGKLAEAKEMSKAADAVMSENGFKPMRLPAHVREALDKLP